MTTDSRRTPYNDNYETCVSTTASLLIYPNTLSPDDVTLRLRIQPTKVAQAGETRTNSLGRKLTIEKSHWLLSSEGHIDSKDLRRHLDWLISHIQPSAAELGALQNIAGVRMGINCRWESLDGQGGPTLWPEQMRLISDLGLECSFSIEFYGEIEVPEVRHSLDREPSRSG